MSEALKAFLYGLIIGSVLIAILFIYISVPNWTLVEHHAKAVERNAATWQVDQKTGKTKFQWNELPNPGGTKP